MHDIVVIGAGPAGLSLALALRRIGRECLLVDARAPGAARRDPRVLALSYGSRQILERLGVWGRFPATPIETIHVSQQGGFGRTVIRAADQGVPALGYVADAADLAGALETAAEDARVERRYGTRVENIAAAKADAILSTVGDQGAATLAARLVAHAEGAASAARGIVGRDYGQQAVICTAKIAQPAPGTAWERFTPAGPLALLPRGEVHAVVFTAATREAERLAALEDAPFLEALQQRFGERLRFLSAGPRAAFPLVLRVRTDPTGERSVFLGNAAQTLHPVAGQGFNLALRDVWSLAELLRQHEGADPGAAGLLRRYAAGRRLDRGGAVGFTDGLIRLFANDNPLLRLARGGGLALLDAVPPARDFVARRMMFGARALP